MATRGSARSVRRIIRSSRVRVWATGGGVAAAFVLSTAFSALAASWAVEATPQPATFNQLNAVDAVSATLAWAVGNEAPSHNQAEILRWSGGSWVQQATPSIGATSQLAAVSAHNATDAWAAGTFGGSTGSRYRALMFHWNGASWSQAALPTTVSSSSANAELYGVAARTSTDAWAVGQLNGNALILHWNGAHWTKAAVPSLPGGTSDLHGVVALSANQAWAVGESAGGSDTLILRWNGTHWAKVASPDPGIGNVLYGITSVSTSFMWAVGTSFTANGAQTLVLRWNGAHWARVASPNPSPSSYPYEVLNGVSAATGSDAWAVGHSFRDGGATEVPMTLHWNGAHWSVVASPSPGGTGATDDLRGVVQLSASTALAAGWSYDPSTGDTSNLVLHCC